MSDRCLGFYLPAEQIVELFNSCCGNFTFRYADGPQKVVFDKEIKLPDEWKEMTRLIFFGEKVELRLNRGNHGFWNAVLSGNIDGLSVNFPPSFQKDLKDCDMETTFPDGKKRLRFRLWGQRQANGSGFATERIPAVWNYPVSGDGDTAYLTAVRYRNRNSGTVEWFRFINVEAL